MWHIFLLLLQMVTTSTSAHKCNPIYVRWPRVKVVFGARAEGPYSLMACRSACTSEEDPMRSGNEMQCSGFNQREGPSDYAHHCQLYQADQLQHVDGFVEADDRYSFYWKYCVHSQKTCSGDYAFTFLSDRYMDSREVTRVAYTSSLEDCLSACLDESNFACRSVSFNRTDGGCHLSQQNQLSKPALLRMNNNPNFRIDYYESNCFNITDSFAFEYECKDDGILVKVDSKYPYTGALYGLYDFFTCRVEPKDAKRIEYFFPSPTVSKNCSDSIRYKGNDMVLEVVLSTDGIEPLYFITPDDLTYQARCPIREGKYLSPNIDLLPNIESKSVDISKFTASARALFSILSNVTSLDEHKVHSTAIHFNNPGKSEATSNSIVASPSSKQSSSLEKERMRITLPFPSIAKTTISTSTVMLQTTPSPCNSQPTTSGDEASATVSISMKIEKSIPRDANFSYKSEEVTTHLSTSTRNVEMSVEKSENSAILETFKTDLSDSGTTPLLPHEIVDEHLTDIFASSASANASDLLHRDTFGKKSLIKEIESNRINEESAITDSATDIDTMHNELSAVSAVLSNATTTAAESTTATSLRSTTSSRFPESTSSDETNEFTTHISFPSILSSRFIPSVTPSSTTKDTFILPFVPTTRSSSATASSTTLQQTDTSLEIPATLASTYALVTDPPTTYSIENANSATITTTTTTSTPPPTTATTIATTSTTTSSTTSTTTMKSTTTTTASATITTTAAAPQTAATSALTKEALTSSATKSSKESPTSGASMIEAQHKTPKEAVMFDIFHNGQPVEAVVVGSRIALSFTPFYAIPPNYMSISGCQVEPIGSLYEWEREPLAIIKDGCQADHVGLVCPPQRTDYGISVTVESFRYQTTAQVQYTCLIRICPFAPCPVMTCPSVEGCSTNDPISRTFGLRAKRHLTIEEIRAALAANPDLQRQIRLTNYLGTSERSSAETQQQLIALGGDHIVKKRLVVVNSEDQLRYYVRTGDVPNGR